MFDERNGLMVPCPLSPMPSSSSREKQLTSLTKKVLAFRAELTTLLAKGKRLQAEIAETRDHTALKALSTKLGVAPTSRRSSTKA